MSNNLYVLRVRLSWARGVWREIAIRGEHTLADLHHAILDAFEWGDDDIYAFYMSGDVSDISSMYASDNEEDRMPTKVRLDSLNLDEEATFLYLFAEGERNQFPIKVMMIDEPDHGATYPDVVDENGESPEQYLAYG